jgi:RNA polymerase sigma-70 factor, ECF subfamily
MLRRSRRGAAGGRGGGGEAALTAAQLDAARAGEPDAVTLVYQAYSGKLYRFFVANGFDQYTAEDLTGQVFVSAIQSLPRFRGPTEAFAGWLFRIARNDLLDYRRSQKRRPVDALDDRMAEVADLEHGRAPDPEGMALTRLDVGDAIRGLRELSEDQREVLTLRFVWDMSTVEVAERLGKSVGAVKALQHRGLASLQRRLGVGARADGADPYPSAPHGRLGGEETR